MRQREEEKGERKRKKKEGEGELKHGRKKGKKKRRGMGERKKKRGMDTRTWERERKKKGKKKKGEGDGLKKGYDDEEGENEKFGGKLRVRRGKEVIRRSNLLAKQVISIHSALSLGFVSQLWVDTSSVSLENSY